MAGELPLMLRVLATNTWLFSRLFRWLVLKKDKTAPLVRTTTAVTIVRSGLKVNLVPQKASAWVNHRIHPDDTLDDVLAWDAKVIGDSRVKLKASGFGGAGWLPPSAVTPLDVRSFDAIKVAVRRVFGAPCTPMLMMGNTDTRHYWDLTSQIFRFSPIVLTLQETSMFHGVNERISTQNLAKLKQFYVELIQHIDSTWD